MTTKTKLIKKGVKKLKEVQDDLFPDTLPKSPDAIKKATKEQQDKLKRDQIDMFPEDLAKRQKDAQMKKDMLGKKKRKKKAVKKAEGGPVEKFNVGGVIKTLWKNRPRVKTVKETEALKKKKLKEKKLKEKTETHEGPRYSWDPDTPANKKIRKTREKKQKAITDKIKLGDKYASGGPVKKSIDGIAQRGLTRAKHK